MNKRMAGFTLLELMSVVVIIGILAVVAIPKFTELLTRSREADIKSNLGALRSAISVYYSDNQSMPTTLTNVLDVGHQYFDQIPNIAIPKNTSHGNPGHIGLSGDTSTFDDMTTAAWHYTSTEGTVLVNCSHLDSKGYVWSSY